MSVNAFSPCLTGGKAISVTATASTAVQAPGQTVPATQHLVYNAGTKDCFLAWGPTSSVAAVVPTTSAANGMPVGAGAIMVLSFGQDTWFSAICGGSDSTTLYLYPGQGD